MKDIEQTLQYIQSDFGLSVVAQRAGDMRTVQDRIC